MYVFRFNTCITIQTYMGVSRHKRLYMVFLMMATLSATKLAKGSVSNCSYSLYILVRTHHTCSVLCEISNQEMDTPLWGRSS